MYDGIQNNPPPPRKKRRKKNPSFGLGLEIEKKEVKYNDYPNNQTYTQEIID
jgi:hypothetical protein